MNASVSQSSDKPVIVLFREDLRLRDNQALSAAASSGKPVVPVFVFDTSSMADQHGSAWRWWLHHSVAALSGAIEKTRRPPRPAQRHPRQRRSMR
ncbi:MAG: deoxyribodipyrimidine photo-lyase [Brucellaceae bacterium]|nr:deoxyribodipyrimidine photo-lyase [Brucellaceae bacterium]